MIPCCKSFVNFHTIVRLSTSVLHCALCIGYVGMETNWKAVSTVAIHVLNVNFKCHPTLGTIMYYCCGLLITLIEQSL